MTVAIIAPEAPLRAPPPDLTLHLSRGDYLNLRGLASCLTPFLMALEWRGNSRAVGEAAPHVVEEIDIVDFCNMLVRLGLAPKRARMPVDESLETFAPCVVAPDDGEPYVILRAENGQALTFDSGTSAYNTIDLATASQSGGQTVIFLSEEDAGAARKRSTAKPWLTDLSVRFRRLICVALFLTFWMSLLGLVAPIGMMAIYVAVLPHDGDKMIPYIAAAVLACLLAEGGIRYVRSSIQAYLAGRIDYLVSTAAFEQIIRLPSAMTSGATVGDQSARLKGFQALRDVFVSPMTSLALELPFLPIYVIVLAILAGSVAFVPVVALLVYLAMGLLFLRSLKRRSDAAGRRRAERQAFLVEMLRQMGAIKQLGAEAVWQDRFRGISGKTASSSFSAAQGSLILQDMSHVVMVTAGLATMALAVYNALEGLMNPGALIAVMALTWRALSPIQGGLKLVMSLERVWAAGKHLNALMAIPPEAQTSSSKLERRISEGAIRFQNVSLRYGRSHDPALLGITFDVKPGELVALVGGGGSGKSSLLKAILRLYDPQAGSILIDDIDIRQVPPPELRLEVGYVPQNPTMLYGTIAQNLRLYKPSATMDELTEACRLVGVLDAIETLPEGLESRFGDHTIRRLPPGFVNCITLAGVLLREPAILLLDEAHDGLDAEMEDHFLKRLEMLRGKTTILMTTHRPSHIRMADRVIELEKGRVTGDGPPKPAPPAGGRP